MRGDWILPGAPGGSPRTRHSIVTRRCIPHVLDTRRTPGNGIARMSPPPIISRRGRRCRGDRRFPRGDGAADGAFPRRAARPGLGRERGGRRVAVVRGVMVREAFTGNGRGIVRSFVTGMQRRSSRADTLRGPATAATGPNRDDAGPMPAGAGPGRRVRSSPTAPHPGPRLTGLASREAVRTHRPDRFEHSRCPAAASPRARGRGLPMRPRPGRTEAAPRPPCAGRPGPYSPRGAGTG